MLHLGDISAGFPSAAEGYEDLPLNLHDFLVRNPAATFFYRVTGDDLREESLPDGTILVVDRSITPVRGKLVVVEHNGAFIVRRYRPGTAIVCGVVVAAVTRF